MLSSSMQANKSIYNLLAWLSLQLNFSMRMLRADDKFNFQLLLKMFEIQIFIAIFRFNTKIVFK